MNTGLLYLKSNNLIRESLDTQYQIITNNIISRSNNKINLVNDSQALNCDVLFVFVSGGGTETIFKKKLDNFSGPVYLIATNGNNSLAASMEILSYMNSKNSRCKIIHDINNNFDKQIDEVLAIEETKDYLRKSKFARIGKPSDWLISSNVDADQLKRAVGTTLIDIPIDELISEINKNFYEEDAYTEKFMALDFNEDEKIKALYCYGALRRIIDKYNLDGLTVRCFDLLDTVKTTSCVAFSLLNAQGVFCSCEGDVPSLMSMATIAKLTSKPPFQANPSIINKDENSIVLAHCTIPLNMSDSVALDTHFESGIGVAVKSEVPVGDATIFKCSGLLDKHFVSNATIEKNLNQYDLCRTQIKVTLEQSVNYFFERSIGNHHIVINGKYADLVNKFFEAL